MSRGIVIVGGGLAGQRCCETLRRSGWDGGIQMLSGEGHAPYDRPPLSKDALTAPASVPAFRPDDWYRENDVELLMATRATRLDAAGRRVFLDDGTSLPFGRLLVATGAEPVVLPLLRGYPNVHALRTFEDAVRLRTALGPGRRLAILGAGFLGLEAAASARSLGTEVDVVDIAPVPLARVLPADVGRWFHDLHAEEGVRMHLGDAVTAVHANRGQIYELELASGTPVACDAVLAAVGVHAATRWLDAAGPIATDAAGRTVLPDVYAAGDAAAWPDPATGEPRWTQQWEAAARQGVTVARAMLGQTGPEPTPTAFWTDQYGVRVQQIGSHEDADETTLDGEPAERDFVVTWRRDGRVIGGLAANRPREFAALRKLLHVDREKGGDHELQGADR